MLKRLVVAASVSALALVGPATSASADDAPTQRPAVKAQTTGTSFAPKSAKVHRSIDWDAPAPSLGDGGVTTQRIDWD